RGRRSGARLVPGGGRRTFPIMSKESTKIAHDAEAPPVRAPRHEALAVFLGEWRAEGKSYGIPDQPADDPRSKPEPWKSTHTARWHSGNFFLIFDEKATTGK